MRPTWKSNEQTWKLGLDWVLRILDCRGLSNSEHNVEVNSRVFEAPYTTIKERETTALVVM